VTFFHPLKGKGKKNWEKKERGRGNGTQVKPAGVRCVCGKGYASTIFSVASPCGHPTTRQKGEGGGGGKEKREHRREGGG